MLLSESQERMLICVEKGAEQQVCELFQTYDLEAVAIGSVTDDGQYRVFHGGKIVADVPVDALAEEALSTRKPIKNQSGCVLLKISALHSRNYE